MTQESRPVGQHSNNYADGDSGPYSSAQWRELFATLFTIAPTAQGPIWGYLNELEVTSGGANSISVDTGACIVNGNLLLNDASLSFTPASASAGATRYDRVVAVLNDNNTTYSINLIFPTVLTDYASASAVQEYACRLAILKGTEGAGAPALVQSGSTYMVPLAQYRINDAGTISALTDQREFAVFSNAAHRRIFVPAVSAYNDTDNANIVMPAVSGWPLPAGKDSKAFGVWRMPFAPPDNMGVYAVCQTIASGGDVYIDGTVWHAKCGETCCPTSYSNDDGAYAYTTTVNQIECVAPTTGIEATIEEGDLLWLRFQRLGTNPSDAYLYPLYFNGWEIRFDV